MTRRELREHCFKMLFLADFYPTREEVREQFPQYFHAPQEDETDSEGVFQVLHKADLSQEDSAYLEARAEDVLNRISEIDEKIDQTATGWRTGRMGKVELTVLRLALYEMEYDDSVPKKVAINEAVELAKKFGGKDSPAFINGILAKLMGKEEEGQA